MRTDVLEQAADLARREEPFVLAVVVRRRPASSAQAGDMALITAAGAFHGWLGGSCTQPTVVREARQALADGKPRLVVLTPDPETERRPGVAVFPMTCHSGGSVEIYLEPVLPAPRLVVFGVSPVAQALARLGKAMGYSIVAVDAAAEPALFPDADQVLTGPETLAPAPVAGTAGGPRFAVVSTMGEGDEEAIRAALALAPAYLGVVASARRFAQMRQTLAAQGVTAAQLDGVRSPAGLDIGARTPEEIALSVLAEIVERRRAAAEETGPAVAGPEPAAREAIDPICGMTVEIATARHTAEHAGRTWYFCCGGCRQRFLAEPERYAQAGAA
jgi:xanthine dehydrogenase accessory factor